MMTLENTIDADTEALQMFAKDIRNVSVFTNHMVIPAPSAGKCNSVIRRNISAHRTDRSGDMPARAQ